MSCPLSSAYLSGPIEKHAHWIELLWKVDCTQAMHDKLLWWFQLDDEKSWTSANFSPNPQILWPLAFFEALIRAAGNISIEIAKPYNYKSFEIRGLFLGRSIKTGSPSWANLGLYKEMAIKARNRPTFSLLSTIVTV